METKISDVLQNRLKGQNLSQIARELGISKSLLADWVSARRLPSMKNIAAVAKLAAFLGISLEQLLLGEDVSSNVITSVAFDDDKRAYRIQIERIK